MSFTARTAVLKNTIVWQWVFIGGLFIWAMMATIGWMKAPEKLHANIAPRLPNEALVLGLNDADETALWQFGQYFLSVLNTWPENGEEDYLFRIKALKQMGLITDTFNNQLKMDYQKRVGQLGGVNSLRGVTRFDTTPMKYSFRPKDVEPVKDSDGEIVGGQWYVWVVMDVKEQINGRVVRDPRFRYKMRVIRSFENMTDNKWGLAIDAFVAQPERIEKGDN